MNTRFARCTIALLLLSLLTFAASAELVMVPTRDGTELATDYFLPEGDGPFPVVVARSVYGRGAGPMLAKGLEKQGLAFVVQDTRGRGGSQGKDWVFADDGWGKNQDGADLIDWVVAQPWCNGKVGTWGMSALGITQVLEAGASKKIAVQSIGVAASDFYSQLAYQGGVWRKALCEGWTKGQKNGYIVEVWQSHPTRDAFWRDYNLAARAGEVTAPALHIGGWWDIFGQGTLDNFTSRQYHGGEGAKGNQKLIIGPWVHGPVKEVGDLVLPDNFIFDFGKYERRMYAHWLLGADNGIAAEAPVNYYTVGDVTRPDGLGNEWRTADDWPPFPTDETAYYLHADGTLNTAEPDENAAALAYTYDPADPCPTHGGQNLLIPAGPFDQRKVSGRDDVLKFATAPLDAPVEITGRVKVRLFVSSDAPDTDFTAKLVDVYPDGREILMLDSIQRLKFRNGFEKADPLPPGESGEVVIDLWSISLIFDVGHRIGVQISSSNYPRFEKNPNSGDDLPTDDNLRVAHNTLYLDKRHPSALLLPVRPSNGAQ
ncbi:MAG: CocE/NonD family hydrolase [Nitrospiraceae bacterium]|nr:CocE/NonD family hydrolase [Nitrospiraceae bacterium]